MAQDRRHLTLLPPKMCGVSAGDYLPFVLFAAAHRLTVNMAYLARWDMRGAERYCADLDARLEAGALASDEIFVLGKDWSERFHRSAPRAHCQSLDSYEVCVVPAG